MTFGPVGQGWVSWLHKPEPVTQTAMTELRKENLNSPSALSLLFFLLKAPHHDLDLTLGIILAT